MSMRALQMRKGFRASVVNGNSMYRFRAMVFCAWSATDQRMMVARTRLPFLDSARAATLCRRGCTMPALLRIESKRRFGGDRHNPALTILGAPTERGAQQASTQEAYDLLS